MENTPDYYAIFGVSSDASIHEIKKAYVKKQKEYLNDEEKIIQLNQAYAVLCDPAKRSQYDIERQFGNQITDIREKIRNSKTREEIENYSSKLKEIYLNILKTDAENTETLWELASIENALGNAEQSIAYLIRLEKLVKGTEKLRVYQKLGELYQKLKKTDGAIMCFYAIYKADVTYKDDILALARLFYEEKKNIKAAIQILNDCINRSTEAKHKILYLYEAIRAVRVSKNASYQKLEETVYAQLEKFRTGDEERDLENAAALCFCMADAAERRDFECLHRLEKIYKAYDIKHPKLQNSFESMQQWTVLAEKGKVHKAIDLYLYLLEDMTKEIREQFGRLLIQEAAEIKKSLDCIKKEAPIYWNGTKEAFLQLEKLVEENLKVSKEFSALSRDRSISASMVTIVECFLLDGWVEYADMKAVFEDALNSFFEREDMEKTQHTLRKMEEFYPICYKKIADIFLEGKSTQEFFGDVPVSREVSNVNYSTQAPSQTASVNNKSNAEGAIMFIIFVLIVGAILAAPPVGLVLLGIISLCGKLKDGENGEEAAERKAREKEARRIRRKERARRFRRRCVAFVILVMLVVAGIALAKGMPRVLQAQEEAHPGELVASEMAVAAMKEAKAELIKLYDAAYGFVRGLQEETPVMPNQEETPVMSNQEETLVMPDIVGMTVEEAEAELGKYQFIMEIDSEDYSSEYKEGTIMRQYVEDEMSIGPGTIVYVVVSLGGGKTLVPNIVGMDYGEAEEELGKYGLWLREGGEEYSADYPWGTIIRQYTAGGTSVELGDTIYVDVSLGENKAYEDIANKCFYLQKESMSDNITVDDLLRYWNVSENDYSTTQYDEEGYDVNVVVFDAPFFGVKGPLVCLLYLSKDAGETEYIFFKWIPETNTKMDVMSDMLVDNGYTDAQRTYSKDSYITKVFEGDEGDVLMEYDSNTENVKEIRFSLRNYKIYDFDF